MSSISHSPFHCLNFIRAASIVSALRRNSGKIFRSYHATIGQCRNEEKYDEIGFALPHPVPTLPLSDGIFGIPLSAALIFSFSAGISYHAAALSRHELPPQTVEIAKIPIPLWIADAVLCGKLHHHRPAPLEDSGTVEAAILQFPHIPPDFGTNLRIPGIYHMPLH